MKQENVDRVYAKLGKAVPKSKRERLKASLVKADDSKCAVLSTIGLASKSPLKGISGLTCFFATLFGALFLVCNLIAFLYISPKYAAYSKYSAKLGDGLSAYYTQLANYGATAGSVPDNVALLEFDNYNAIVTSYNSLYKDLQEKKTAYNKKFTDYRDNLTFTGNKTANYLNVKVQLAGLKEPEEGVENYEKLKDEYDKKKAELEKRIADYETKVANLEEDIKAVDAARAEYDVAAEAYADVMRQIIRWQKTFKQEAEEYKASLYNVYLGGSDGIIAYMNNCSKQLCVQLAAYESALKKYEKVIGDIAGLPSVIAADKDRIANVEKNYAMAITDLKTYAATVTDYRLEYNKYVSDNAYDLTKYNKLVADLGGVLKTDENDAENVQNEKIAAAAEKLLEDYKNRVDAFAEEDKVETNADYKKAKEIYDLLYAAINGKETAEIPQAVKDVLEQSRTWIERYNAKITEYTDNLRDYDKVLSLLNLTGYGNLLVERVNITEQIGSITGKIEAETDGEKKAELQSELEKLNDNLKTCNENIVKAETTIAVEQEILNAPAIWTDDYYINLCKDISDNAYDLTKHNKLVADLDGVLKTDENDAENVQNEKIAAAAEKLLEDYKNRVDAFAEKDKVETNADYKKAKEIYDLLYAAINGKETAEIPQAVKDVLEQSKTWIEQYEINKVKRSAFETICNAASSVSNSEKIVLINDKFRLSETVLNKENAENEALNAYYSAEQLSVRLQTALNVAYDLSENLNGYYSKIKTSTGLDRLEVTEDMRKTVQRKLAYEAHVEALADYLSGTDKVDITTLFFDAFEITDGEQCENVKELVKAAGFENKIEDYIAVVNDVNGFKTDAFGAISDYDYVPDLFGTLVMVYDIIAIVIFAAYFVYTVCNGINVAKNENYENIKRELAK